MAINDAETIDAVGIEPGTDNALLIVSDDLDWSDPVAHINALQQKIGAYLAFIRSGQLEIALPESVGRTPKIGVIQQYEPPPQALDILAALGEQLNALGVEFGYGPLPEGYAQA